MKAEIRWTHFSGAYKEQIVKRLEESVSAYAFGETATEKGEKACVHSFSFGYRSPLNETAGLALEAAWEILPDGSKRLVECSLIPAKAGDE